MSTNETSRPDGIATAASLTDGDLAQLLELATHVATEAATLAAQRRREGVDVAATKSSMADVVTAADIEAEALIRARLADARPDDGFYGEESEAVASRSGITWVVDPIDGTVNYLYGSPNYAVSVAAVIGDPTAEPSGFDSLVGAVVSPELNETYTAIRGGGAFRNGARIRLGQGPTDLAQALVATGFGYTPERRVLQAQTWLGLAGEVRDLRRVGAASLDLVAVATQQEDVYYEFGLKPWDWAAGALVAREAGAIVCGMSLEEPEGRGILVCGHPEITPKFLQLLSSAATPGLH